MRWGTTSCHQIELIFSQYLSFIKPPQIKCYAIRNHEKKISGQTIVDIIFSVVVTVVVVVIIDVVGISSIFRQQIIFSDCLIVREFLFFRLETCENRTSVHGENRVDDNTTSRDKFSWRCLKARMKKDCQFLHAVYTRY